MSAEQTSSSNGIKHAQSLSTDDSQPTSSFDPEASVVLLGIRGTGKSTLAVIASIALNRRLIDADTIFKDETGLTPNSFRESHGTQSYERRQLEVLRLILERFHQNCVIVMGVGWMDHGGKDLVDKFAATHPVVHVLRDAAGLAQHLNLENVSKAEDLLSIGGLLFRNTVNSEFYNLTEEIERSVDDDAPHSESNVRGSIPPATSATFLVLKRTEIHFRKFLTRILGPTSATVLTDSYPLSRTAVESRYFTNAVAMSLDHILDRRRRIDSIEVGCDAFEIIFNAIQDPDRYKIAAQNGSGLLSVISEQQNRMSEGFARVRRDTIVPVILHVHVERGTPKQLYMDSLRHCFRLCPEFVSIDLGALQDAEVSSLLSFKATGSTKVIGHFNDITGMCPEWSDSFWLGQVYRAKRLGCDVIRLLRPCKDVRDNFAVVAFREKVHDAYRGLPLIAYNTGLLGRLSTMLNPTLTSVLPPAFEEPRPNDSSQKLGASLTSVQVTQSLCASFAIDPLQFFVFGASNAYSVSPAMHNAGYRMLGLPHNYTYHESSNFDDFYPLAANPHFGGASLSLPFKTDAFTKMNYLSSHARAIGAINTVIPIRFDLQNDHLLNESVVCQDRNRAGPLQALYGENTDWIGIRACIGKGLSPANAVRKSTIGLIIGAGGMARATVYAMLQLGVQKIVFFNRTPSNAQRVIDHFSQLIENKTDDGICFRQNSDVKFFILNSRDDPWPTELRDPTVIVSCIPTHSIGEVPAPDFTLPEAWMKSSTGGVVVELGYKTLQTPLLRQVRSRAHQGWTAMDGLDLVPEQGFPQFELFTGRRAPRRLMKMEVLRCYHDASGQAPSELLKARLADIERQ